MLTANKVIDSGRAVVDVEDTRAVSRKLSVFIDLSAMGT